MALKLRFYRCNTCGNIVQVFIDGPGELVCCGKEMELLEPQVNDTGSEKHVPYFETLEDGSQIIKIGSELHPMVEEHYIQFIESLSADKKILYIEFFEPNQSAVIKNNIGATKAFEYCNMHGLWEGNND